jgi:hypothetical protein
MVMPLYAVLVREYFGARIMGTVFGAVAAGASLGDCARAMVCPRMTGPPTLIDWAE